ncbi:hypothetical protein [Lacimicrobium alkaliphilum]|uniref:hypothetical protein n=1 Tax=Lacimicrobium alkaliphilum TaxID=1526571 RepID=UPI0009E7FB26|nr:hypothetical protein [Lacimicrobium alkaliphilum]
MQWSRLFFLSLSVIVSGCIALPVNESEESNTVTCELSSDRKVLKVVDVAKDSNSYYSISGIILTPILLPSTAIISGSYVLINNLYHIGEKNIVCGENNKEVNVN